MTTEAASQPYPVRLTMAYPEKLSRGSTLFRIVLVLPVVFFLYVLQNGVVGAILAAILVRGRIPHWLFDFQVGLNRFTSRASAYFLLLTDQYPPFEGDWALQYEVDYPERPSRWRLLFWKIITALPHFIVLAFLWLAALFVVFIAWWAILFTGRFPRGLHAFVVGVMRWSSRATAYVESLTDVFPPFSLENDAGAGRAQALAAVLGGVLLAAAIGGAVAAGVVIYAVTHKTETAHVSLQAALAGSLTASEQQLTLDNVDFTLIGGDQHFTSDLIAARTGYHLVEFTLSYKNRKFVRPSGRDDIELNSLRLATDRATHDAVVVTADRVPAPLNVRHGAAVSLTAYFEIDDGERIQGLEAFPATTTQRHVVWKFDR